MQERKTAPLTTLLPDQPRENILKLFIFPLEMKKMFPVKMSRQRRNVSRCPQKLCACLRNHSSFLSLNLKRRTCILLGIGTWGKILEIVTKIAILTNACLIAFMTDIIDRIVYKYFYSPDGSLYRYMDFALSVFNTSDWDDPTLIYDDDFGNVTECRYQGSSTMMSEKIHGVI